MYIHIYVYIYVYIHIHIYVYLYTYLYIYTGFNRGRVCVLDGWGHMPYAGTNIYMNNYAYSYTY
jgi:hypothetical protein